jgi:hypothetical protein
MKYLRTPGGHMQASTIVQIEPLSGGVREAVFCARTT